MPDGASGNEEGFRVFSRDHQELKGSLAGPPGALLPTAHGVGADVQVAGKQRLAGVERAANRSNFLSAESA